MKARCALLLLSIAACGGSSGDTSSSAASSTTASSAAASSSASAAASSSSASSSGAGGAGGGGGMGSAGGTVDKSANCAATFGETLTDAFGRLDGTVLAVVPPNDQACALPNMTHLVIQVTMQGAAYRLVLDVLSNQGDPDVFFFETDAPLVGEAWSEGWHTDVPLDYVTTLALHSTMFQPMKEADLVAKVTSEIELGAHISIFGTSQGEHDSAHLIHRNVTNADGAIVVGPDSGHPHYLLFRFDEQQF